MPKLKTKKSLSKRVKVTKNKKAVHSKGGRRHLLSCKTKKRKRQLKRKAVCSSGERELIKKGIPY